MTSDGDSDGDSDTAKQRCSERRYRDAIHAAAEEFICPISLELPINPVTAEDGRIYEKSEIERFIVHQGPNLKSPVTNERMGRRLLPAVQIRNAVEGLVRSGTIMGPKADQWRLKIKREEEAVEIRRAAEGGDASAMITVGNWYRSGSSVSGYNRDSAVAYQWYKKAADMGDVRGLAMAGFRLVKGRGVKQSVSQGLVLMGMALQGGSDMACYNLGVWYGEGLHGLPTDIDQAQKFLKKAVDGSCPVKHASKVILNNASSRLQRLSNKKPMVILINKRCS